MAVVVGFIGKIIATGFFKTIVGRILLSVVLGAVQSRLAKLRAAKNAAANAGIRSERTLAGSKNPIGFILGRYATGGQLLAPEYPHGSNNTYNTFPISLGFIRGQSLNRLIVDGEVVEFDVTSHASFGRNVLGKYADRLWVKFADGSQTVVDPLMSSIAGSDPDRPWTSDMIGRETCIAYVTIQYDEVVYSNSQPNFRFDVNGIPLYDLRKDSTAGGVGAHRWNDPLTWEHSLNPVVMIYNILRGIPVVGIGSWGGETEAEDFRFGEWAAAMNKADTPISGSVDPRYRAGFEVFLSDEPNSVISELLRSCGGELADVGGIWRISLGQPDVPVFFFSDPDIIITESSTFDPFPGIGDTFNTVFTTYVNPDALWETTEAPMQTRSEYLDEDDGRQLAVDLPLSAVFSSEQAQDLSSTLLSDNRRFRTHSLALPPAAVVLEPLDTASWSSDENGYVDKLFEIDHVNLNLLGTVPQISIRERDPDDYDFTSADVVPFVPVSSVRPSPEAVLQSFAVFPFSISDGLTNRRPAIRLTWAGSLVSFATGVEYEVRTTTGAVKVVEGSSSSPAAGNVIISEGILPEIDYEVRARVVAPIYDCPWSAWLPVTASALYLLPQELDTPAFSVAGLSVFGGALESDNFDAGLDGWRIDNDGNAEFNQLIVRQDMIVSGAVSNRYFMADGTTQTISASAPSAATVIGDSVVTNFSARDDLTLPTNPVKISVNLRMYTGGVGRFWLVLRKNMGGGVWSVIWQTDHVYVANSVYTPLHFVEIDASGYGGFGNSDLPNGETRFEIYVESGGGNISVQSVVCNLEQLNR